MDMETKAVTLGMFRYINICEAIRNIDDDTNKYKAEIQIIENIFSSFELKTE